MSWEKQLLCELRDELRGIKQLLKLKEEREVDVVFINIPENQDSTYTRTFSAGTTKIYFVAGIIKNPDGSTEQLDLTLRKYNKEWLHSITIETNKNISLRLIPYKWRNIQAGYKRIPYVTFNEAEIYCTEDAKITIFACTNPSAIIDGLLFPSDIPDVFGNPNYMGTAELANRFNSPLLFVKTGSILYCDKFDQALLNWNATTGGTGTAPAISTVRSYMGASSVYLAGGESAGSYSLLQKYFYYYNGGEVSIEGKFSIGSVTGAGSFQFAFYKYDGTNRYEFVITYNQPNTSLTYWGSDGSTHAITDTAQATIDFSLWYPIRLTVDLENNKYVSLFFCDTEYDLSNIAPYSAADATAKILSARIRASGSASGGHYIYFDDFAYLLL